MYFSYYKHSLLRKIGVKDTMLNNLKNGKLSCGPHSEKHTGHYDTLLTTIEGRREGKRGRGRPKRTWIADLRDWTRSRTGSNGIDIEVWRHHMVSVSNFQSIEFRLDSSIISIPIHISSIELSMPILPNIYGSLS